MSVTITTSDQLLKPMIVFKGNPSARIVTCEFLTYPIEFFACQDQAWWTNVSCYLGFYWSCSHSVEGVHPCVQPVIFVDLF
jgi:hypothetical protein